MTTACGRDVAIKVPPEALARDSIALARFEREARAVASLAHQNVLDLHDFGTDRGICYAVTELLEGETLRARLADGPLRWQQAAELAIAVADGLAAAHIAASCIGTSSRRMSSSPGTGTSSCSTSVWRSSRGRPGNAADSATRGRERPGTVPYMSPEQVRGERADARSDIFSLGCVLSEMVTGERVFHAETSAETLVAILREDPADPGESLPIVPRSFYGSSGTASTRSATPVFNRRAISPCLFETCLIPPPDHAAPPAPVSSPPSARSGGRPRGTRPGGRRPSPSRPSSVGPDHMLAVLPFVGADADPNSEYLTEGLTEGLINRLSRFRDLRVAARTSVFALQRGLNGREAGRTLDVQTVLTGRVERRAGDLIVHVELMDVAKGSQLWGERIRGRRATRCRCPKKSHVRSPIVSRSA